MITHWGYTLPTQEGALPNFLTDAEFDALTASKFDGDVRIDPNLAAVSNAIRNYCNWHIYPSLKCEWHGYAGVTRNITRVYGVILIQLPATYVTQIEKVEQNGTEITDYILETNGLLRILHSCVLYDEFSVTYVAGLPNEEMSALKELAAHRVTHALSSSYGVTSESTGGVSVTYNAGWAAQTRSTALADDNKEVLQPYKVTGVF